MGVSKVTITMIIKIKMRILGDAVPVFNIPRRIGQQRKLQQLSQTQRVLAYL